MTNIDIARQVVANKQFAEVDGLILDTLTASTIVAVYDNLNENNQRKLNRMSLDIAAGVCLRMATSGA